MHSVVLIHFVALQIIGWLHPLDVIHLSRSSRFFRTMLMSKNNALLWKAARQNVPGLPDCPQVLAEPRYAAFLFDQYCFVGSSTVFSDLRDDSLSG